MVGVPGYAEGRERAGSPFYDAARTGVRALPV